MPRSDARRATHGHDVVHAALWNRALVYFGICLSFFFLQLVIATLLDRARWKTYPKLFLLAPFSIIYFWVISLTSFVVGFSARLLPL
ncbi:MAG: hypothetical protein M3032_12360 [Verrucomicrobiota bacterium]|nr:hypothetical protein [Verrucomicrobiota bacterium]